MCVDMWQLGIVGMCMLAGTIQVPTLSHALLFANNLHRKAKMGRIDEMTMECWTNEMFGETQMQTLGEMIHSTTALDFIAQLLRYDPAQRLTAEQALQHRWFQEE